MSDIYLVSQGCYSDYGILGVFDKKDDAQLFIDKFQSEESYDAMEIEIMTLNPFIPELKKGFKSYCVRIKKDGDISECEVNEDAPSINITSELFFDMNRNLVVHCMAKDNQHAIKIANERRVVALAENRWRK